MRFRDSLESRLELRSDQLRSILKNLELLERDVLRLERSDEGVSYCVDFSDLFSYLALSGDELDPEEVDSEHAANEYARVLMFNRLSAPLILLPPYYDEFQIHMARFFWRKSQLNSRKEIWLQDLEEAIRRIQYRTRLFSVEISAISDELSKADLDRLLGGFIEGIRDVLDGMQKVTRAAGMLSRFDALVGRDRISGLGRLLERHGLNSFARNESVFLLAKELLTELRPELDSERSNDYDAEALALLCRLNESDLGRSHAFVLVSSADTMRRAVEGVNVLRATSGSKPIELRTPDYWWLWFVVSGEGGATIDRPTLAQVEEFGHVLRAKIERWLAANDILRSSLIGGAGANAISAAIDTYLDDSSRFLREIWRPLFDMDWKLSILDDVLLPLDSVSSEMHSARARILELFELVERADNVQTLEGILDRILALLDSLLLSLRGFEAVGDLDLDMR